MDFQARAARTQSRSRAKATGTLWELFQDTVSCNHGFTSYIAVLIDRLAAQGA